jgi:5-formyltetrahydrofolate cyclo-ligase
MTSSSSDFVSKRAKSVTRQNAISKRDAMSHHERTVASDVIATQVERTVLQSLPSHSLVALYCSKGSEVQTVSIETFALRRGLRVAYPRVIDNSRVLKFFEATQATLIPSRFGLREPRADSIEVALDDVAAMIVPAIAVDATGARIGWGRGYYDATLPLATSALRVATVFDCQWLPSVPRAPHDSIVNLIITESQVHRIVR